MERFSFVIPVRDEQEVLPELHRRLEAVADQIEGECEFIFIDDGSTDRTREVLSEMRAHDPRVKLLFLARNFGHQLAITAGLDFAEGDAVVIMDGDLQDPPEAVLEMIPLWREGYEVVHAVRRQRAGESRTKLWTAHAFYRVMHRLSDVDFPVDAGDFRLVDRRVADVVRSMREPDRYLRGMFSWVGFRQTSVTYDRDERYAGKTKNSWRRMIGFAIDGILGFSVAPLRFILGLGFVISALSLAWGLVAIIVKITGSVPPGGQGWASLTVLITFLAGVQLIVLGMIGLYVARAYEQGKHRPLYLVASAEGLDAGLSEPAREHHVLRPERQPAESGLDPSQ
jgi:glycosyltransferase involved in cell wall biosynthesis